MPDPADLSRRRALRVGGGGVLALVIGGAAGWADRRGDQALPAASTTPTTNPTTTSPTTTVPAPVVIPEIGQVDPRIVTIGRRVVEVTGEDDLGALLALFPATDGDPIEVAASRVSADFERGDTITVDGWVLAASEARATAVIALLCDETAC